MQTITRSIDHQSVVETRVLVVECLGAFAITYVGSWAIIFNNLNTLSCNGVALAHALITLILMWFAIPISGAHFNPAITLGLVFAKRIDYPVALFYIAAQFAGAIVAAGFIFIQLSTIVAEKIRPLSVIGIPQPGSPDYEVSGFWGETIGTFLLMLAYISLVADSKRHDSEGIGAPAVAFAIYICSMTLGEVSGAGLNPARSLGPALVAGQFGGLQMAHLFGPIIGAIFCSVIYSAIFGESGDEDRETSSKREAARAEEEAALTRQGETRQIDYELKDNR